MFEQVSKYRTQLMGIAIVWVIIFHSEFSNLIVNPLLKFPFEIGYGGVDIFLFLSGFGLYFSSLKQEKKRIFYYRRFVRLIPAYMIVILINMLLTRSGSLEDYLLMISTIGFWTQTKSYDWYVPSLACLYILFPFVITLFKRKPYLATIFIVLISLLLAGIYSFTHPVPTLIILFLFRIPIFSLGVLAGYLAHKGNIPLKVTKVVSPILLVFSILGFILLYMAINYYIQYVWRGSYWLPFILIVPGLVLYLARLVGKLESVKKINRILSFMGNITLELYLIHLTLFEYRNYLSKAYNLNYSYLTLFFVLISVVLALFLHKLILVITKEADQLIYTRLRN